jgi:tetratricopeptide (TPR) repeat protein
MGYWVYYLGWLLFSYALHRPWAMAGVLVFVVLRPFLPDPVTLLRTWRRIRSLSEQVRANPANVTARRDLAVLWLERGRPGRALELLEEANQRDRDNAEILYLIGLARLRTKDFAGVLAPIVRAVELDPRVRFGEPYMVAAEALRALGRLEEAEDALDRYVRVNSSAVRAFYLLGCVRAERGDTEGARKALAEARATFWMLPWYRRRTEIRWWAAAVLARVWL